MTYCPSCGNPTRSEDKFCANCGKTTPPAAVTPIIETSPSTQPEPAAVAAQPPPSQFEVPPPSASASRKSGMGATTIVLSVGLALAVIFGGGATWQWLDNSGQVKDLTAETESLATEKADLNSQISNLTSQIQTLSGSVSTLEADKAKLAADLAALKLKYPLKDFQSEFQLQSWLLNAITKLNPLDEPPAQYYMLQRLAMDEGYFISVAIWEDDEFYYPELYAVADGVVYICYEDGSMYVSFVL